MDTAQVAAPKRYYQKWWFWVLMFGVIGILYSSSHNSPSPAVVSESAPAPATPTKNAAPKEVRELGGSAFLRLPNVSDTKQVICLSPTKEVFDEYSKALMAKDYQGILDLADKGLFCVGNGSEVKVIDTDFAIRKVRVVAGVNAVDQEKVGRAGWVVKEWVVDR